LPAAPPTCNQSFLGDRYPPLKNGSLLLLSDGTRQRKDGLRRKAGGQLSIGVASTCDYSLQHVASRPARVGDKLVSASFLTSCTRGFAAVGEPNIAVCLLPGTELAFEENVKCESAYGFGYKRLAHKVARFRQVNKDQPNVHHDALELPDGEIVLVTKLAGGQHATVLQLPASPCEIMPEKEAQKLVKLPSLEEANR
jgi:hypothetical protein